MGYNSSDYDITDSIYLIGISELLVLILYSITFLLGTPGNMLAIWIAGFKMKTINAVWILHLAIADLISCVSLSVICAGLILYRVSYNSYELYNYLSWAGYISVFINMSASVNFLSAMSIDRCISVMRPIWYKSHRTSNCVHITAAVIWVISLVIAGPHFYSYIYYSSPRPIQYTLLTLLVIYFIIIFTCYSLICFKIKKVKKTNSSQRPYRVIIALVTCFFICWGPYYIFQIRKMYFHGVHYNITEEMLFCLACFNSCINPIIYLFIGQDFKETLIDSLPPGIKRLINGCYKQTHTKPESTVSNTDV